MDKKQYYKDYYARNKERIKTKGKKYYQNNTEKVKASSKKRRETHKEFLSEYYKEYALKNKDALDLYKHTWYEDHKEDILDKRKRFGISLFARYRRASKDAVRRHKTFTITFEEYTYEVIKPCYYCNNLLGERTLQSGGLDRIDNAIGYEPGNICSCCKHCNAIKGELLTQEETKKVVDFILQMRGLISSTKLDISSPVLLEKIL